MAFYPIPKLQYNGQFNIIGGFYMPILVILIIIALAFYVTYKIRYVRTRMPMEKRWLSGKSSIALGIFVSLFGINSLFLFQETTTYIVASIFIVIGIGSVWAGYQVYRHYTPLAVEEADKYSTK